MAYIINRFDGTELTVVDDGILDTTTSLGLVGRNYVGYGETQNENYVFLLENFSGNQPPARALSGQLWYDASNKAIRVYNGTSWTAVGNAQVQETEPIPSQGGLWLKSTTNQLFVSDGAVWRLVGPEAIEGFNTTKLTSRILRDAVGPTDRPVITVSINGEIIAIYSNSDFTIFSEDSIPGFGTLNKGLNFKTGFSVFGNLKGNADTATKFLTSRRINTVSFDGSSDITIKSSTTNKLNPGDYIVGAEWDGTVEDIWNIDATPLNRIGKVVARDSNGDFSAGVVTADLVGNVTGNITATSGTSTFSNVVVSQIIRGTTFIGNATTATQFLNPPTINTVLFDGTENITLPVPAETLVGETLAPNILSSSLRNLGKLEFLEIEAPGLKVGDGNDLSIFIEGFTPTIRSDVTDIIKFELFTGSTLRDKSDISFVSARTVATDGGLVRPALVPDWNKSVLDSQKIMLGTPTYRWRNVFSQEYTGDSLNILQVNSIGAEVQFNDPIKASAGLIGNLSGNVIGDLVGNVTGNLTGSASLNMLKSGDTMTGDLSWTASGRGIQWSYDTDGASIKFYSTGEGDPNTRLEFNTFNNGTEHFLWTHTYESGTKVNLMRLDANDNFGNIRLQTYGNIEASGLVQANRFIGNGSTITNIAAGNISSGRISNLLLNGSYDIDISGNSRTVTSITTGQVTSALGYTPFNSAGGTITGDVTIETVSATLTIKSNRDNVDDALLRIGGARPSNAGVDISMIEFINYANQSLGETYALAQIAARDLNANSALKDGWIIFRTSDNGTLSDNMILSEKGNLSVTGSVTATSFIGNGSALSINASNLSSGTVPVGRLSGTYNITITGQAATVTTITSGQIVSALGFTPFSSAGGSLVGDLTINKSSPIVTIKSNANAGEDALLRIGGARTGCSSCDIGMIEFVNYSNQSSGGNYILAQISAMDPRNNHVFKDGRLVFRTSDNGTLTENMSLSETGNLVVAGSVTASSFVGNGSSLTINASNLSSGTVPVGRLSGTYNITITGNAASATNSTTASNVSGGFVSATTGSFSGVLNVSAGIGGGIKFPNDAFGGGGDTASITLESVSGEKTRLRFRVTNDAGISAVDDKAEFLVPDNDSLLVNNYVVLNAANYNNYTPSKTGTGASGTWPINISGTAATVSSISGAQVTAALGYTPANGSGAGNINGDQNYQDYLLRRPTIIDYSLYHNALGSRTGSVTINCESGNYVSCTAVGAINFSFGNPATGQRATGIILELTNGGNYTVTWPSSVRWPAGTAPTLTVSGVDVLVFITDDGGSTWRGAVSMSDSR